MAGCIVKDIVGETQISSSIIQTGRFDRMQTSGTTEVATEVATGQTQNPATQPEPPCNVIASTASPQGAELSPVEKPLPADSTPGG